MTENAVAATPHADRAAERLGLERLRARLSPERLAHTLSVAETAYRIATALGWDASDRERALSAGLLHDVAKELPADRQRALAGGAEDSGPLLHARAGARLAQEEFGIEDDRVLAAVAAHPTGTPEASPLTQLLFVADYLEPRRRHLDMEDRTLLESALGGGRALDELFCRVLRKKLDWLRVRDRAVHPQSVAAQRAHCGERAGRPSR
jgi:predicted HD superfamily hydrolase involved in NAD metabolism